MAGSTAKIPKDVGESVCVCNLASRRPSGPGRRGIVSTASIVIAIRPRANAHRLAKKSRVGEPEAVRPRTTRNDQTTSIVVPNRPRANAHRLASGKKIVTQSDGLGWHWAATLWRKTEG